MQPQFHTRYFESLIEAGPFILLCAVAPIAAWGCWRMLQSRRRLPPPLYLGRLSLLSALAVGLWLAWKQRAIVDDAFISFRYAENLLHGRGLVFNVGERVEGFTNFLWTSLLAGFGALGGPLPQVSLVLSIACYVLAVIVVYKLGKRLFESTPGRTHPYIPLAAILLAVQGTVTAFATSGLETSMALLWVVLGAFFLTRRGTNRAIFFAGFVLILATLTRPDHAVFYATGSLVVAWQAADAWRQGRRREVLERVGAYSAPFALWLTVTAWRWAYYGSILPNTYYAKSADEWYLSHGMGYIASFLAGAHFWVVVPMFLGAFFRCRSTPANRRFLAFAGFSTALFAAYLLKVGGDFMYGRFLVSLIPLVLLGAELFVYRFGGRRGLLSACLLAATAHGLHIIEPGRIQWGLADENSIYRLTSLSPIVVNHPNYRVGRLYGEVLHARGIPAVLATSGIGMLGYYSELEVVDCRGLTDAHVAHLPVKKRGRPGHEKWPEDAYLLDRGVHFGRFKFHPPRWENLTRLRLPKQMGRRWYIVHYDVALMARVASEAPEIGFVDFPRWLDAYIGGLADKPEDDVLRDLGFFDRYYFRWNRDDRRRALISGRFDEPAEDGSPGGGSR